MGAQCKAGSQVGLWRRTWRSGDGGPPVEAACAGLLPATCGIMSVNQLEPCRCGQTGRLHVPASIDGVSMWCFGQGCKPLVCAGNALTLPAIVPECPASRAAAKCFYQRGQVIWRQQQSAEQQSSRRLGRLLQDTRCMHCSANPVRSFLFFF